MKFLLLITIFVNLLFAQKIIQPQATFLTSGGTTDMIVSHEKLYVATEGGCVDVFELKTQKKLEKICVEKIVDFMGDVLDSKIYSIDLMDDKLLILSQSKDGFARVHIYQNSKFEEIISHEQKLSMSKAKFLDEDRVIVALLSNEIFVYSIKDKKRVFSIEVSQSKFSDFVLDEQKEKIIVADESGNLKIFSTKEGTLQKTLSGENLDNVFQVDTKNSMVLSAGQDRKAVVYDLKKSTAYAKNSNFLIYSVGLSPSALVGAYSSDEENNVKVFDTKSKEELGLFGNNKMSVTKILFVDEDHFLVGSDDKVVNFYKIK